MPDVTDWGRIAIRVDQEHEALGHRTVKAAGAVFVRNPALPDIHIANYVRSITAASPGEIEGLLARAANEFADCPHRCFEVDLDTPPSFEGRLVFEGYEARDFVLMVLEGELHGQAHAADLRLVTDEHGSAEAGRLKTPPDRKWLAHVDGEPRGMASAWTGVDEMGQVEDVFVEPDYRHRGLATELIHRCVADCRAGGSRAVALVADGGDTPQAM